MKSYKVLLVALSSVLFAGTLLAQTDYGHGNGALQVFDAEGQANSPRWVMLWIMFMLASFVAGLLFVKNHPVARWVVGGFVVGMICLFVAQKGLGIPPISGFIATIHLVCWSPGLYQLLTKRPFTGPLSAFSVWSAVITLVILFSFVFDLRDAFIYLRHIL